MSDMKVSKNVENTTLYIGYSSKRYIDVANAAMLLDIHLSFTKSFTNIFSFTREGRDGDQAYVLPVAVEISLQHSSNLQSLTIENVRELLLPAFIAKIQK